MSTLTFRSFPGSAWERTASEALPQRAGGACNTVRYEAEPRNESNSSQFRSFPGSDALTETTLPIQGSVDKKTQRAAWTVGDNQDVVYETGIYNLTREETQMLIHFGKDNTQQWQLVRLENPEDAPSE